MKSGLVFLAPGGPKHTLLHRLSGALHYERHWSWVGGVAGGRDEGSPTLLESAGRSCSH